MVCTANNKLYDRLVEVLAASPNDTFGDDLPVAIDPCALIQVGTHSPALEADYSAEKDEPCCQATAALSYPSPVTASKYTGHSTTSTTSDWYRRLQPVGSKSSCTMTETSKPSSWHLSRGASELPTSSLYPQHDRLPLISQTCSPTCYST